ncbi:MAG: type II toxin-antitoxin system prevent-host-death family antitoxin [Atopobiaceae bacterium]|jgi:prevent-host-death family protein|nr:type II toxin-antitoxin system Phd/YefM family antitoxin [Atopobiaceae bacterium]MCH4180136.1 type II toxin-antitoxin system Phd/YefM family antitoxin [Atopobiaceae bacterium]MCH4213812.1 type II toxin-antitoxin system Phd/YefM family antitoxin [Atopobiaceae bacterium]MCH4229807.1 type II toxin-antitoxin system Phd/YefM family antitoxin [Atopobiaceae bacterium]MCH4275725.1 type II toxin-antitoxin system Phd/YefM family antitoxin [Atopobiaceae bacterium]
MPLTASFTDVRRDLTTITNKVMEDHVSVTVFKHNKPAFKIVPIDEPEAVQSDYVKAAMEADDEYFDMFERLAK